MTYQESFEHITPQFLAASTAYHTDSGLSIRAKGTAWAGFHTAFKGDEGTELVIGEHCEVEIVFLQEVEQLLVEFYVVSDQYPDDVQMLIDTEGLNYTLPLEPQRNFYWITLSGSGFTEHLPGPVASQPHSQLLFGPFRRLTISTSQAGTVHIRKLAWTRTCRH
ncbi:hypothetical protein KSS94_24775 [Pseudomonas fakonensis]|uniref:Uncharacterized protein n=1 Tax=Pseudomonas fakonensis TaxID=2842355 RepID=A0ABX8N460_9PSED|nr:hypothetical protein [Pseudomonas fakonensis]QXH51114.1 hypothetical protein KSS94_24775 [Pseudomonas fakonensis]